MPVSLVDCSKLEAHSVHVPVVSQVTQFAPQVVFKSTQTEPETSLPEGQEQTPSTFSKVEAHVSHEDPPRGQTSQLSPH